MNKFYKFYLLLAFVMSWVVAASAQVGQSVTGTIVDESGQTIIGANVIEQGNQLNGSTTDFDGNFAVTLTTDNAVLNVSYLGYVSQEIAVGDKTSINIVLHEDSAKLEEVVVVGYGVQKKKLVTGATSQVSGEDIEKLSSNGIMGAMQSKVTGVSISSESSQPGADQKIVIRGLGTIGNAEPLYVIDGVVGASMSMLNPSDIASIDILKDAASAAIYGSRAANGVVLITTKRGKKDTFEVRYDGYYAVQNPAKVIEGLNAQDFMTMQDERRMVSEGVTNDWADMLPADMYASIKDGSWKGTNWIEEMTNRNAPMQNHAVSVMGGSDRTQFSLGYSYTKQEGIFGKPVTPMFQRHNGRINLDNILMRKDDLDIVKLGTSLIYSYSQNSGISTGDRYHNDVQNAIAAPSIMPLYDSEGNYYDRNDAIADGWNYDQFAYNPIGYMVDRNQNLNKQHNLFANAYLEVQPIKDLKIKSSIGYKLYANSLREFSPEYYYSDNTTNGNEMITQSMGLRYSYTWENTANYKFNFKEKHDFDIVLGQSIEKSGIGENMSATNTNMTFAQNFNYAWLSNTSGVDTALTEVSGSPYVNNMLMSFFGRLNYNFDETYMVSLMLRADGSSIFAPGKRWGYFPSASAGWVVSNEEFMENTTNWLDFLKLRASWGQNGNCNIANFQYLATVGYPNTGEYSFASDKVTMSPGAYATILANPNITWETSEQIDLGIDATFLHSRLAMTFDLYQKSTKDWLVKAPILDSFGAGAPFVNGGDVRNRGIELGLSWRETMGDFSYSVGLNGSYNANEITRIANSEGIINGTTDVLDQNTDVLYRAEVGKPIGYFYGYKTDGIFQNQAQVDATEAKVEGAEPGDVIFKDLNGDGVISPDDRTMIGNPNPDFIVGLNINLAYKGVDLAVTANGAFGQQIAQNYTPGNTKAYSNYATTIFDKRWHGEGTSNSYPRIGNVANTNKVSDIFIQDADYVKIQNITLGYDVNRAWKKSPLKGFRVYASLQNWFTITGYDGADPAVGYGGPDGWSSGIDLGFYPSAKSFIFGTNIAF